MSIASASITINGQTYALTYNSSTGKWQASITAPGATSYNQANHYYPCTVTAINAAGTSTTADTSDATVGSSLRLVVRETIAPMISILSPSSGAYSTNNKQPAVFTITDESGGSGIDLSTLAVKLDNTAVSAATLVSAAITNGYSITYTPAAALTDGSHTLQVSVSDHDGNAAAVKSTTWTQDTVAPTLNVTAPAAGLITNSAACTVAGTTNDATSSPVTVSITLNGASQGTAAVGTGGAWSKSITLAEGSNTIAVTAADAAGKTTIVTRTVTLDTSAPVISAVSITPNPADTGATMLVQVTIA